MTSDTFYTTLPSLNHFVDLANPQNYVAAPPDWYVLITDVVDSTQAIEQGHYKAVNLMGASSIMAVLNALTPQDIPFTFGGDGAVLLVPPSALQRARVALLGVRAVAQASFGLNLRVGVVPVAVLPQTSVRVAKLQLTPTCYQASFMGGGITHATELIKTDATYRLDRVNHPAIADLSGLECRWQAIPSDRGHTLSLIVMAPSRGGDGPPNLYQEVLETIQGIYGDRHHYHPVNLARLRLALNPRQLWAEAKARGAQARPYGPLLRVFLETLLGYGLMALRLNLGGVNWGRYKQDVWAASDYQKIDDSLRMVMAGSPTQTNHLQAYLDHRWAQGQLTYGLHVSDRALITCLIMNRRDRHIHLIDSADGGYALAARDLKSRLKPDA